MPEPIQPVVIFADLEADLWGVLLGGEQPRLALGGLQSDVEGLQLQPAELDRGDDRLWTVSAGGNELRLERAQATTATPGAERRLQPLRVSGSVIISGRERELEIAGAIGEIAADADAESVRMLGSWFPAGHEVCLLATRPRGAKGHDRDEISVAALGETATTVFDPRLSTTYNADGSPRQVGLELWIGADEDDEAEHHPRRVAGVATGASVRGEATGISLSAHALRCLSRDQPGAGVHVLLRQVV